MCFSSHVIHNILNPSLAAHLFISCIKVTFWISIQQKNTFRCLNFTVKWSMSICLCISLHVCICVLKLHHKNHYYQQMLTSCDSSRNQYRKLRTKGTSLQWYWLLCFSSTGFKFEINMKVAKTCRNLCNWDPL